MTTIAWDGLTIAADKLMVSCGSRRTTTKLFLCGDYVYGGCGDVSDVALIAEWLTAGAKSDDRPKFDEDSGSHGVAIKIATAEVYAVTGKSAVLARIEDRQHADGSGRDVAMTAMMLGKSAREAIEIASRIDAFSGEGVDAWEIWPGAVSVNGVVTHRAYAAEPGGIAVPAERVAT
jgi:hypothetical protein